MEDRCISNKHSLYKVFIIIIIDQIRLERLIADRGRTRLRYCMSFANMFEVIAYEKRL